MTSFPHLFSPLKVGSLTFKNRIISAPMGAGAITAEGWFTAEASDFYELLAKGGVASVCIGETLVDAATGNNHGRVARLDNPSTIPSLYRCTDAIHRHGALASIELVHPGQRSDPIFNKDGVVYGPSSGQCHYGDGFNTIVQMDEAMIEHVVEAYGTAAEMAMTAGCDFVTVHGGHGWLLNQFLSPANNKRSDRFGGSIENRCRIFLMVAERIRAKCGPDFPIDFRISGDDFMEEGATLEDTVYLAKALSTIIDLLHVSATSFHSRKASIRMFPSMFYPPGVNAFLAAEIKKHVPIPVVTVGGFSDPALMEELIAANGVDAIAIARGLLADPMLPEKARSGQAGDIIGCMRCNNCMSANFVPYVKYAMGISHCPVNPWFGLSSEYLHRQIPRGNQRVLVVGGGPAGMEAALGAAECGHRVILCEKSGSLGGMLRFAWHAKFKHGLKERFVDVLARRIESHDNIELRLNTEVTPQLVQEIAPDALIVCIGAQPMIPPIPGINNANVLHITGLQQERSQLGKKIVIIGGGLTGCEEGLDLAKYHGKDVTILEMSDTLAAGAPYIHYLALVTELEQQENLHIRKNEKATSIGAKGVHTVDAAGAEHFYEAGHIIVATGLKSLKEEAEAFRRLGIPVSIVGDCHEVAQMNEAVLHGYFAGYHLQRL